MRNLWSILLYEAVPTVVAVLIQIPRAREYPTPAFVRIRTG